MISIYKGGGVHYCYFVKGGGTYDYFYWEEGCSWAEKVGYYAVSKIEKASISSVRPNDTYQNYVVDAVEKALISAVSFSALFV